MITNIFSIKKKKCLSCHHFAPFLGGIDKERKNCYSKKGCAATHVSLVLGGNIKKDVARMKHLLALGDIETIGKEFSGCDGLYQKVITKMAQNEDLNKGDFNDKKV